MMKNQILIGDCKASLATLPSKSVHCVVTSPPYWNLRDYGVDGQLGMERAPAEFIANMVSVFREVWRVLRDDGTLWLNIGDTYCNAKGTAKNPGGRVGPNQCFHSEHKDAGAIPLWRPNKSDAESWGMKGKDLVGIPWMLAFALRSEGWYLRSDIIWHKPNPMPESVTDRPTKSHEYIFMLTKSQRYYFDQEAIAESSAGEWTYDQDRRLQRVLASGGALSGGTGDGVSGGTTRNKRSVWTISTHSYPEAHFATFPEKLIEPCILSGTSEKGCCPDCGAPWARTTEKIRRATRPGEKTKVEGTNSRFHISRDANHPTEQNGKVRLDGLTTGNRDTKRHVTETQTTGWQPGCECSAPLEGREVNPSNGETISTIEHPTVRVPLEPIPCTVLDPFGGAGTTGLVAAKLNRNYILCELNPDYAAMAEARIRNRNAAGTAVEPAPGQRELFP